MENLHNRINQWKIFDQLPKKSRLDFVFWSFSKKERMVFLLFLTILIISTLLILQKINKHFMVAVPAYGSSISEGIIGTPRFINPVLAFSDVDQDMVTLIYSGLMRKNQNGEIVPDLAEKYEMSEDGLNYIFTLKNEIYFHDEKPVTVDDVIFTINQIKNPVIKSPRKGNWDNVTITKIDEKTIKFSLKKPYAPLLENTTIGIMPAYLWNNSPIELNSTNTNPVGSGPYMVSKINKQSSGTISSYELKAFKKFALGKPYIKNINLYFYLNEETLIGDLQDKVIDQISSITPLNTKLIKGEEYEIESVPLPRIFGIFFNQNVNQLFVDKTIIRAIDQAIDKDKLVREVLIGYGIVVNSPIPPDIIEHEEKKENELSREEIIKNVNESLAKDGWEKNANGVLEKSVTKNKTTKKTLLEFSISTINAPELMKVASMIQQDLMTIGMNVSIKTFESGNLNQEVIRPRKYDALLFGQIINNESDLYAFWHSSQRTEPGLNVSMYANVKIDKLLEDAFITVNKEERLKKYLEFETEIKEDMPAVFLYAPNFIYVVSNKLQGFKMSHITSPRDRFSNVNSWYLNTDNVWKIFAK